jgi:hypothetical protein
MKTQETVLPKQRGGLRASGVHWSDRRLSTWASLALFSLLTAPAFFMLVPPVLAYSSGGCTYVSPGRATVAGILAIVAAVVAIINAVARVPVKPESEEDSRRAIGYILHLSAGDLRLRRAEAQRLTVHVLQLMADGHTEPVSASIVIHAPAGVGLETVTGRSPLSCTVWQTDDIAVGAVLVVRATAAGGFYETTVTLGDLSDSRPGADEALQLEGQFL